MFFNIYHGEWSVCLCRDFYCFLLELFPPFFLQVRRVFQTFILFTTFVY